MPNRLVLRTALATNAGFSAASGLVLTVMPGEVAGAVDIDAAWLLRGFGIALLGHAAILFLVLRGDRIERWAKLNLAMIAPYPVAMLVVAASIAGEGSGRVLVLADGAAIALIAAMLAAGLRTSTSAA